MKDFILLIGKNKIRSCSVAFLASLVVLCNLPLPLLIKAIIDSLLDERDALQLHTITLLFILLTIVQVLCNFLLSIYSSKWTQQISAEYRFRIYQNNIYTCDNKIGQNSNVSQNAIISDCELIGNSFQELYIVFVSSTVSIIAYFIILVRLNLLLAVIVIGTVPMFVCLNLILSKISKDYYSKIQNIKDSIIKHILDTIRGFTFITLYSIKEKYCSSFSKKNLSLKLTYIKFNTVITFISSMIGFFTVMIPFLILLFGSALVFKGKSTLGEIIACYAYSTAFFSPIGNLIGSLPLLEQLSVSRKRVEEVISRQDRGRNKIIHSDELPNGVMVKVTNLSLSYDESDPVIVSMTKCILKNTTYILSGPNASGKSTFAKGLVGMVPKIEGNIEIKTGGKINYIPQDTYLFEGTIFYNITIGIEKVDMGYLKKLLSVTQLEKDLHSFGMSIDTIVNNDNSMLSTGQVQKIKFIRSMLSKPDVLILDEILSNMDDESQNRILVFLRKWAKNHVLIIITHNMAKIKNFLVSDVITFPQR